jgi:transcriptional regulator with XRE-family HTH domain
MKLTKEQIEAALEDYMQNPVHFTEFAKKLGVATNYGANILRGKLRLDAKRPENFVYNLNEQSINRRRNFTDSQIAEALRLYVENRWETTQFSRYLNTRNDDGLAILKGETYKGVPRPAGLVLRRSGSARRQRVKEGLELYFKENWTTEQLADYVGFSKSAARRLLSGETYQDIPTPTSK